jgi:hypothetical protein
MPRLGGVIHTPGDIVPRVASSEARQDRLYLDLKGARECLCRAQTVVEPLHVMWLQEALNRIDQLGVFYAPRQWSKYDEPPLPSDE